MIAILVAMSVSAAPVDYATALKKAKNHLANKMYSGMVMSPSALNPVAIRKSTSLFITSLTHRPPTLLLLVTTVPSKS